MNGFTPGGKPPARYGEITTARDEDHARCPTATAAFDAYRTAPVAHENADTCIWNPGLLRTGRVLADPRGVDIESALRGYTASVKMDAAAAPVPAAPGVPHPPCAPGGAPTTGSRTPGAHASEQARP